MKTIHRIQAKLERAKGHADHVFGAEQHNFELLPVLAENEVKTIEEYYEVTFPLEYRTFVRTVGNGGAGPGFGLMSLQRWPGGPEEQKLLKQPFPFTEEYNPSKDPRILELEQQYEDKLISWKEYQALSDPLWEEGLRYGELGNLAVCHEGCGYLHRLIVTGPARGTIWLDGTVSDYGYLPLGVTFLEWYEKWLDDILSGNSGTWWLRQPTQAAPRSIEELSADAVSHDHSLRRRAAYELGTSRDTAAVQVAISLLSDEDRYVRLYAIQALGELKPIESVPALICVLQSETDELILTNTIRAVVNIGDVRVVPALIDLTRSTDPFIRHDVAWALGELGDKRAIPALEGLRMDTTKPEVFDEEGFLTKSSIYRVSDQAERALYKLRPAWRRWLRR